MTAGTSAPTVVAVVSAELFGEFFSTDDAARLEAVAERLGGTFVRVDRLADAVLDEARVVVTSWGVGPFDHAVLATLPKLELIAHTGATIKPFATDALFDRGVRVTQAGAGMARSVAEVSLTFTLALLHRVPEMHDALRAGDGWWDAEAVGVQHEILGAAIAVISRCSSTPPSTRPRLHPSERSSWSWTTRSAARRSSPCTPRRCRRRTT